MTVSSTARQRHAQIEPVREYVLSRREKARCDSDLARDAARTTVRCS